MDYMKKALELAEFAEKEGEIPVGCVIVCDNKIIAEGYNKREKYKNALYHAEIEAIDKACRYLKSWRLDRCDLYVTMEPCPMCAGAILNSRIRRVYFGCFDEKMGCCESKENFFRGQFGYSTEVYGGFYEDECKNILNRFFKNIRKKDI